MNLTEIKIITISVIWLKGKLIKITITQEKLFEYICRMIKAIIIILDILILQMVRYQVGRLIPIIESLNQIYNIQSFKV